jgi:hypothetical protein
MRRLLVAGSCLILVVALGATLVGTALSASKRPDLTVSDLAEPPQAVAAGTSFRQSFAVANQGNRSAGKKSSTSFFLDQNADNTAGRTAIGRGSISNLAGNGELNKRVTLTVPAGLATGDYFLVACADATKRVREARESNQCRVSGQKLAVGGSIRGPAGPPGEDNEIEIPRTLLPIGRATQNPGGGPPSGDDEKSDQRKELAKVGPVSLVADCKRTDNGNGGAPDAPFTSPNSFNEDGDEAKILVYTDSGTVSFNSLGQSSRRNIPPGEGDLGDLGVVTGQATETNGAEGTHMAIAAARDPDQTAPEDDWAFAYRVGTIYITHSNGTELVFTGYAGIDVLGADDQCVFSGVLKKVKEVA